jgi:hypothetical protein
MTIQTIFETAVLLALSGLFGALTWQVEWYRTRGSTRRTLYGRTWATKFIFGVLGIMSLLGALIHMGLL